MGREAFQNFATSALSASITNSSTSLSVTGGSGSSFPSANFVICIDTELIFISSRSTDTLTVGTRGWDGTTAAAHNSGTTVQLSVTAYNMNHLWANVPDTFNPMVPPTQSPLSGTGVPTGSANAADNEMEAAGSWVLNPSSSLPTGAVFDIGTTNRSHLTFKRGTGTDNSFYVAYVAFTPGSSSWTATCKMSDAFNVPSNGSQTAEFHFFASDSTTPTTSDPGNAMRIDVIASTTNSSNSVTSVRLVRCAHDTSGVFSSLMNCPIAWGAPVYLRMNNDGAGRWQLFFGDGITYTMLVDTTVSITVATLGLAFFSSSGNTALNHTVLVDFVRVLTGTRLQFYG